LAVDCGNKRIRVEKVRLSESRIRERFASKDQLRASTLLNEQGWNPDLIELKLAHMERK
jgi:hypothetical protein